MTEEKVEYTTGTLKPHHFSKRLKRNFRDGDLLTRLEATQVISENSERDIQPRYLIEMVRGGRLHPERVSERIFLYPYAELKKQFVSARAGHPTGDRPTDNALRQRKFKARRRSVAE